MRGRLKEGMWGWGGWGMRDGERDGRTAEEGRGGVSAAVGKGWEEAASSGTANRRLAGHRQTLGVTRSVPQTLEKCARQLVWSQLLGTKTLF